MQHQREQYLGHYRLDRVLGQGGQATVYLAQHRYLNSWAAIKVLHGQMGMTERATFIREAQLVASLSHPHILHVLDFGIEGVSTPYLVMEYTHYGSLRQQEPPGQQVPMPAVQRYVQQMASALQCAHDAGLLHRDVKPENMLLRDPKTVVLADFGIAIPSFLQTREVIGTVGYMAPEQFAGKPCAASDQYALAVATYEWITGRRPFVGNTYEEVARQHLHTPPPPLRHFAPWLSFQIEQVVLTGLQKDPARRYPRIADFAYWLSEACRFGTVNPFQPRWVRVGQRWIPYY